MTKYSLLIILLSYDTVYIIGNNGLFIAGAQIDDKQPKRAGTRVAQPPGGKSSALW